MADSTNLTRRGFLGAAAAGTAAMVGAASADPGNGNGPERREYIVGVSGTEDDPKGYVEQFLTGREEALDSNETLNTTVVGLPENAAEPAHENFRERLDGADAVKYVEENVELTAQVAPNDPRFDDQYADQQVNAPDAWDQTFGDASVTVGVVDQGIKYDHPDLDGNMDGSVSNYGRDFVDDDADSTSDEYHGTHVGGIAAAEIDNGEGVTGIRNSGVLSGRVLSESGSGSTSDIADAITWAVDEGADVVNLSLGGGGYTNTMKNAVSYAADNGALVVAAAGNDGQGSVSYPAAYSECLAVSALDPDETLASSSNYGSDVELAAPGTNVLSTWTDDAYESISGTSMATPVVAGVAGLTLAQYDLSNAELRDHLKATAVDVGLSSDKQGAGRVDAANAVTTEPGSGTAAVTTAAAGRRRRPSRTPSRGTGTATAGRTASSTATRAASSSNSPGRRAPTSTCTRTPASTPARPPPTTTTARGRPTRGRPSPSTRRTRPPTCTRSWTRTPGAATTRSRLPSTSSDAPVSVLEPPLLAPVHTPQIRNQGP